MCNFTNEKNMTTSSSPCNIKTEELQLIEIAPPFWKNSKKILSRQLSNLETERELAWEKKRRQMRMLERKREHAIENANELSDEDVDELKGCIDLGFVFDEEKGGQNLANTLPALDHYFAVNRIGSPSGSPRSMRSAKPDLAGIGSASSKSLDEGSLSLFNSEDSWKFSTPGGDPQQVKTKLRHWAQLVACSVVMKSS